MKISDLPDEKPELDEDDDTIDVKLEDRKKDYSGLKYVRKQTAKLYEAVEKAFEDKYQQNNLIEECWDIYNCTLNQYQQYNGKSQVYVPVVRDAMNARKTRFVNMLFPQNGRYADVVNNDGNVPYDLIALLDYYAKQANLRSKVVPAMIRAGDVSGNYALYIEWGVKSRFIVNKEKKPELVAETGEGVDGSPEYDDVSYEEVKDERAVFSVLDVRDLVVLPVKVDGIEDAEVVAIALRYTEAKIREMVAEGVFEEDAAKELISNMSANSGTARQVDTSKKAANAAGVQTDSKGNKTALIYQVWSKLKIRGERRMMVTHYGASDLLLGCKRNPYWNDRVPVILQALEQDGDGIWGKSQVDPVKQIQYQANDAANMGMDSAQYALLPIVMTDPEKNPQMGSIVLSMAALWSVDPNSTKFASFPALWKDAFSIVSICKEQVFQSLSVSPAMIPHGNDKKKPSQAEVAQAQQIAVEGTNDEVGIIEEVLAQVLEWCYDLDYQYRDKPITIKKFGQLGLQATMDQVEPFQTRQRLTFRWYGLESFRATQQVQQMISWGNVLTKMPKEVLNGRRVDLGPMLEYITEVTCGPRIAPHVLIDQRHELSVDPETENQLMDNGFPVQTHPMDPDIEHLKSHMPDFQAKPTDHKKGHILEHMKQLKEKAAAAQAQSQPKQLPASGGPKAGAVPQPPTGAQNPPGAVRPDNMPTMVPRKAM